MNDELTIYWPHLASTIAVLRRDGSRVFLTTDAIRLYMGGYFKNARKNPRVSLNAQFGRMLQRRMTELGIELERTGVSVKDDLRRRSKSAVWRFV